MFAPDPKLKRMLDALMQQSQQPIVAYGDRRPPVMPLPTPVNPTGTPAVQAPVVPWTEVVPEGTNLPAYGPGTSSNADPVIGAPPPRPLDQRETLEKEIQDLTASKPHKQNPWLDALYYGLQATQRLADPMNQAGAYDPRAPLQGLGAAKKQAKITKAQEKLAPIYQRQQARQAAILAGLKGEKEIAELGKTRAETAKIQADTAQIGKGKPTVKQTVNGVEVELPAEEVYKTQQAETRAKIVADAQRLRDQIAALRAKGEYDAKKADDENDKITAWEKEVSDKILSGQALQNEGEAKGREAAAHTAEADRLEKLGGVAEAAAARQKAVEAQTQSDILKSRGNALVVAGNELRDKGKPKPRSTYDVPAPTTAPASRPVLEQRLKARGIQPGSPEWVKVMTAAGY